MWYFLKWDWPVLRVSRHNMPPMFLDSGHLFTRFTREKMVRKVPLLAGTAAFSNSWGFVEIQNVKTRLRFGTTFIFLLIFRSSVPPPNPALGILRFPLVVSGWPKWSLKQGTHVLDLRYQDGMEAFHNVSLLFHCSWLLQVVSGNTPTFRGILIFCF